MKQSECHPDMKRFWEMLAAGLCGRQQLLETLESIGQALPPEPMGNSVSTLARDVRAGQMLSEGMRNQPRIFSPAHVCLMQGGEYLGIMDRAVLLILEYTWRCPTCGGLQFPASKD